MNIDNFNITVKAPNNVTEVKGFYLLLHPENPGYLKLARLAAPTHGRVTSLSLGSSWFSRTRE